MAEPREHPVLWKGRGEAWPCAARRSRLHMGGSWAGSNPRGCCPESPDHHDPLQDSARSCVLNRPCRQHSAGQRRARNPATWLTGERLSQASSRRGPRIGKLQGELSTTPETPLEPRCDNPLISLTYHTPSRPGGDLTSPLST